MRHADHVHRTQQREVRAHTLLLYQCKELAASMLTRACTEQGAKFRIAQHLLQAKGSAAATSTLCVPKA